MSEHVSTKPCIRALWGCSLNSHGTKPPPRTKHTLPRGQAPSLPSHVFDLPRNLGALACLSRFTSVFCCTCASRLTCFTTKTTLRQGHSPSAFLARACADERLFDVVLWAWAHASGAVEPCPQLGPSLEACLFCFSSCVVVRRLQVP